MELEGQEINVGNFRADILCKNENGSRVLIENQLETTNHEHLGQILTYAAGLGADTVIWIAEKFRDEHRAALDRQNEMTEACFQYFGLEIELWRIGDSLTAPKFNIVSTPNNWSRTVSQGAQRSSENLSETQLMQEKFWTKFAEYLTQQQSSIPPPNPKAVARMTFGIGKADFSMDATLLKGPRQIRIQLTIRGENATAYYHLLKNQVEEIDRELGELEWEENPGKISSSIALYKHGADLASEADSLNQHQWLESTLKSFDQVFRSRIRELNAEDWVPEDEEDD